MTPYGFVKKTLGASPTCGMWDRVYLKVLCTDGQAVAQTVLNALEDEPAIVLAHGKPLIHEGDAARVPPMLEPKH